MPKEPTGCTAPGYLDELETKDKLLASIHKISSLLTRPISLDTILTAIVKEISHVFDFTRLAIFLTDRDRQLLECRYIHGFSPDDSERALRFPYRLLSHDCVETKVARLGKTIYVKDYQDDARMSEVDLKVSQIMRRVSTVAAPLKIKKDVIGLITADRGDNRLVMTRKDVAAFSTFANQASIVIENARLQEQNKKKIKQLLTLQEIGKKASAAFNLEKLFQVISVSATKITRASCCLLFMLDDEGRELSVVAARGGEKSAYDLRLKLGAGLVGWVAKTGTAVLTDDVRTEPRYLEIIPGIVSQLSVPLIGDKRVIGVLHVASPDRAAFSEDDLKLLLIFAGHCASLIKNARLYDQVMTERNFRENILESSPASMVTINLKKEITSVNRKTEELFRFKRRYVLGAKVEAVFSDDIVQLVDLAIDRHAVVDNKEIQLPHKDGTDTALGITSSLLRNHQGNLIGAMFIIRDLTEEKRTEELIRRIDRLTSLGQLSAGIAHEIRNPLSSINFNVQLLAKKNALAHDAGNLLADTQEGIDRIRTLVKGMLDFAKPSLPALKSDSLARVVQGSIGLMDSQFREKGVEVRCVLPDNLPPVIMDVHQIQQVLVNLLLNAMEAMPEGGTIGVRCRVERSGRRRGDQVVLQISDQGSGISRDNLSRIFNPFFTTKPEGTGLGLAIVHKILEQHQVSVDVASDKNRGTAFTLKFPVHFSEGPRCTDTRS
ncbi:MAG: GAF domain-containing protein [Desulfobulbus sp.]|jgi:PAS domain S-box-containing protein|uniref:GAF domain-containing protein n=1 Tax=Desulfobulbus sp. TaxID=895 RepID=UPI00283D741F|nr:GAF domain-containing protein [Desulfobulbus sp.]MDR2549302.1 GAF domain-containing protein [Desulfobulbus sp.]